MITLIILIAIVLIGILLVTKSKYHDDKDVLGVGMIFIFGIAFVFHCSCYFFTVYNYKLIVSERNSFEQTLTQSRLSNNNYEAATILKEVIEWNKGLAKLKYQNSTLFLDQYIDDRIDELQPIK